MCQSRITKRIPGKFSSGSSLQDLVDAEFRSECHWIGERQGVSVMGPRYYQIDSLGIFSGSDPVKNYRK